MLLPEQQIPIIASRPKPSSVGSVTATICITPGTHQPLHPLPHRSLRDADCLGDSGVRPAPVSLQCVDDGLGDPVQRWLGSRNADVSHGFDCARKPTGARLYRFARLASQRRNAAAVAGAGGRIAHAIPPRRSVWPDVVMRAAEM